MLRRYYEKAHLTNRARTAKIIAYIINASERKPVPVVLYFREPLLGAKR